MNAVTTDSAFSAVQITSTSPTVGSCRRTLPAAVRSCASVILRKYAITSRASGSATPSGVRFVRPLYESTPRRMFSIDFVPSRGIVLSAPSSSARSRSASEAIPSRSKSCWAVFIPTP